MAARPWPRRAGLHGLPGRHADSTEASIGVRTAGTVHHGDDPCNLGPTPRSRVDVQAPPQRPETVAHVEETGAEALGTRIEADPIVGDLEAQPATVLLDADDQRGAFPGVLGGVLDRFQTAEVHGRLYLS